MNKKILLGGLLSVFVFNISAWQSNPKMEKRFGETDAEFEARKKSPRIGYGYAPKNVKEQLPEERRAIIAKTKSPEEIALMNKKWADQKQAQAEAVERAKAEQKADNIKKLTEPKEKHTWMGV